MIARTWFPHLVVLVGAAGIMLGRKEHAVHAVRIDAAARPVARSDGTPPRKQNPPPTTHAQLAERGAEAAKPPAAIATNAVDNESPAVDIYMAKGQTYHFMLQAERKKQLQVIDEGGAAVLSGTLSVDGAAELREFTLSAPRSGHYRVLVGGPEREDAGLYTLRFGEGSFTSPQATIAVTPASATVAAGSVVALTATVVVEGTKFQNPLIRWFSSNPAVARVSEGSITAVGPGTAEISATWQGYSASASINVDDGSGAQRRGIPTGIARAIIR